MKNKPLVFATQSYQYMLGSDKWGTFQKGLIAFKKFEDGESYHLVDEQHIRGRVVCLVGGTETDSSTLELFDLACHISTHKPSELIICIPYYGYSTMERAVKYGEIVKAKTRAKLLSAIPGQNNTFLFLDLHSEGIPQYLEGNATSLHLYAKRLIIDICHKIGGNDFVLASTDAGRAKWVESLAGDMGVQCAIIIKRHTTGSDTEVTGINADVRDKHVIIYDDMIRTGGSVRNAVRTYLDAGAMQVSVVTTHGVFTTGSAKHPNVANELMDSGISYLAVTNSHPNSAKMLSELGTKRVELMDVSGIFIDAINDIIKSKDEN